LPVLGATVAALLILFAVVAELGAATQRDARAGQRLLQLGDPARALARLDAALARDPGDSAARSARARARLALAELAVAEGLDAELHRYAHDLLVEALADDPADGSAARLLEAIRAIRRADAIWNQYDWPSTIGELRKAERLRPDLPGLVDKLRDAVASYELSRARSP
jgi:tetratricopeptide (TPR) repeat protein